MQISRSVCPYDCPDACGLLVYTEGDKVVRVQGDPDHPFTRGTLCPKMAHYEQTIHSERRILTPLVRQGPKGSGEFYPITWDEAIQRIAHKWKEIIKNYGAEAILPCSYAGTMGLAQRNCGHAFFYRLGASELERTICSPAKGYGWKSVMGNTPGPHPNQIQSSDLIILWGINALATNIHITHDIQAARQRGAKVWLIDTYETPTAKLADRVFITRPGTDGALALGIMHVLAENGLVDKSFIKEFVQGYDELAKEVLPHYSPESVSSITGIDIETIKEMACLYAKANAPFIRLGSGLSRYGNGAMTVRTITCLPSLIGAWKKRGGGLLCGTSSGVFDASYVSREEFRRQGTRVVNINQLGDALNQLKTPPIMSLYVYISNPANVLPDQNKVLQGLARDDLFTVVHERFMTDTAKYADIILPATTSVEHSDLYTSYGHYAVQRANAVIPPIGEAKSNWEAFSLLAKAMGFNEAYFQQSIDQVINTVVANQKGGLTRTQLENLNNGKPVEIRLPENYKTTFKTKSGKIEILNPAEVECLPTFNPPHGDSAPFWLINSPTPYLLNSSFNERDELLKHTQMLLQMNSGDAKAKKLEDGQKVVAFNERGEVTFHLKVTDRVPAGIVVTEGVWWIERAPGTRSINALTSQRLTDKAKGSTFYDVKVDVRGVE